MNELIGAAIGAITLLSGAGAYYLRQLSKSLSLNPSISKHVESLEKKGAEIIAELRTMNGQLIYSNNKLRDIWDELKRQGAGK